MCLLFHPVGVSCLLSFETWLGKVLPIEQVHREWLQAHHARLARSLIRRLAHDATTVSGSLALVAKELQSRFGGGVTLDELKLDENIKTIIQLLHLEKVTL